MSLKAVLSVRFLPLGVSGTAHAALIAALIAASPLPHPPLAAGESVIEVAMVDESAPLTPASLAEPNLAEPNSAEQPVAAQPPAEQTPPEEPRREQALAPPAPDVPEVVQPAPAPQVVPAPAPKQAAPEPARARPPRATPAPAKVAAPRRQSAPSHAAQAPRGNGGSGQGRAAAPGNAASGAAYAGRVRAILQGRANALGLEDQEGAVGVSFVIGASGRMESHAITRSSGSGSVDRQIRGMLASSSFPPPPGGRFSGSVTIRIQ